VVRRGEDPEEIEETEISPWAESLWIVRLLKETGMAPSTSEGRRLVEGGGVSVDGVKVEDPEASVPAEQGRVYRVRVGKRRFLRIRIAGDGGGARPAAK
jgi:tyrosyl-tRNA synthetase